MSSDDESWIRGYFDGQHRAIVGLRLGNGEYVTAQVDTGFNGLLLFSAAHALELGLGLPEEYDQLQGAGSTILYAGEVTGVPFYWLGEYRMGTVLVVAPPIPGTTRRRASVDEQEPVALIGTRLLNGCQLSMIFHRSAHFPVRIWKLHIP